MLLAGTSGVAPSPTHTFILWDVATLRLVGGPVVGQFYFSPYSIAFKLNGEPVIAASVKNGIALLDFTKQEQTSFPLDSEVFSGNNTLNSMSFSPDGQILAIGTDNGPIYLWSTATHQIIGKPLIGHTNWVQTLDFSSDGRLLASGSADDTIRLWNVATQEAIGEPLKGLTSSAVTISGISNVTFRIGWHYACIK